PRRPDAHADRGAGRGRTARGARAHARRRRVPGRAARVRTASRELLASRADVWGFLAEPYHLSDWWPGIAGIELDPRGFAPGARWKVRVQTHNIFTGLSVRETMLIIGEIDPFERWTWRLL